MTRPRIILPSIVLLIIVLNFKLHAQDANGQSFEGLQAPSFILPDLNGNQVNSESYKGSYLVIHIATTWCPFCNAEAPHLEQLNQDYKDKNVKVLIIDVKEPKELVQSKLQDRFNFSFPVLLDTDGTVAASFAPEGVLPDLARDEVMLASNILIDPEGKIRFLSLLDSKNFDAKLVNLRAKLDVYLRMNKIFLLFISLLFYSNIQAQETEFVQLINDPEFTIAVGNETHITLLFQIKEGYHIQAAQVKDENLIPTVLSIKAPDGFLIDEPLFPPAVEFRMKGVEEALEVYSGIFKIIIPVNTEESINKGTFIVNGKLHYQACDDFKCYFPRDLQFKMRINVE